MNWSGSCETINPPMLSNHVVDADAVEAALPRLDEAPVAPQWEPLQCQMKKKEEETPPRGVATMLYGKT